jgi:hypothetical protein
MDGSQKRKPPRLNATSNGPEAWAKHGFDVHVVAKPDGNEWLRPFTAAARWIPHT